MSSRCRRTRYRHGIVTRYGFCVNGSPVSLATWFVTYGQRELSSILFNFQIFTFVKTNYNWVAFSRIDLSTEIRVYLKFGMSKNICFNFDYLNIFPNISVNNSINISVKIFFNQRENVERILIYWYKIAKRSLLLYSRKLRIEINKQVAKEFQLNAKHAKLYFLHSELALFRIRAAGSLKSFDWPKSAIEIIA